MLSWTYGGSRKRMGIYGMEIDDMHEHVKESMRLYTIVKRGGGDVPISLLNELYTGTSNRLAFNGIGLAILLLD